MTSTVRALKSAKIRVIVLNSTIELLGKKAFKDLYVEEVCAKAKISKVTFFKYFAQKEDVLLYYYRKWCLEVIIELQKNKKEELAAVSTIFDHMASTYQKYPGLILGLLSYFSSLGRPPAPFPLKPEERELLFPDVQDIQKIELLSLPQLLEKHLLEAVFQGKIRGASDTKELAHQFLTIMYGSIMTCHVRQVDSLHLLFKKNIDTMIKGLN